MEYNGGISVKLGSYTLKCINSYEASWSDETEEFENWDYSTVTLYKGRRFKLSVSAILEESGKDDLITALSAHTLNIVCPDYEGEVAINSVSAPIQSSNFMGTYYKISFSATATELSGSSGSL